eukprot:PITA_18576
MEGLSNLIKDEHHRGRLKGIKITEGCTLTHLLFVDDILVFINGSIGDISIIKATFTLFQVATGMIVNDNKSSLTSTECTPHEIFFALQCFHFSQLQLAEGLKYLDYMLKPLGYKIAYWTWLIAKLEKRLNTWYFKYLSRAGRLTLIKSILEATPGRIFAWVKWEALHLPKKWGRWGLKKLKDFSLALAAKLGQKLVAANSLWTRVTYAKYIAPLHIMDWIRRAHQSTSGVSIIWKAVLKALSPIREGITWRIRSRNTVQIGLDPWVGCGDMHRLPKDLILHLQQ